MAENRKLEPAELTDVGTSLTESAETILPTHWIANGRASGWGLWSGSSPRAVVIEGCDALFRHCALLRNSGSEW